MVGTYAAFVVLPSALSEMCMEAEQRYYGATVAGAIKAGNGDSVV